MNGKRILSFILALVMVLGMVPFNALPTFAAEVNPTWDTSVTTSPYVITVGPGEAGSITKQQVYDLLDEKWDCVYSSTHAYGGFMYGDTELRDLALEISGGDSAGLVAGQEYVIYYASKITTGGFLNLPNGQEWTSPGSIKVVEVTKDSISVANNAITVGYNMGKTTAEQWSAFRTAIIAKLGAITANGSTTYDASKLTIKFRHYHAELSWDHLPVDEYLELNAANASEYDTTEDKASFQIGYGNADPVTITVSLEDNRLAPLTYTANAETKNGVDGIKSAAATAAAELGLAAAEFTVPADWESQMAEVAVGESKVFAVTATYGGGAVYKPGTVTVNVTVTKSDKLPAVVTVTENEDHGDVVITNKDNGTVNSGDKVGADLNPLTITVTPHKGTGYSYYVDSITVNGVEIAVSYAANGVATATFNVTNSSETENDPFAVHVTYGQKKLEVNAATTKENPVGVPFNFGTNAAGQLDQLKQDIFTAVVNAGASLPAGLGWADLTYEFYAVGKISGNYNGNAWSITNDETGYNAFGERGDNCVEKIKLTWGASGELPTVSIDAYIRLEESRTYTITWVVGENTYTETYGHGETVTFKGSTDRATDDKYSYAFTGWDKEIVSASGNATYTAQYSTTPVNYKVTWVPNGGVWGDATAADKESTFGYGIDITVPETLTKIGYEFAGWYTDASLADEYAYTLGTMPAGNITLYAKWDINEYTITFNANGGMFADDSATKDVTENYGDFVAAPVASYTGYNFVGWFTAEGVEFAFTSETTMPAENITLYAKWEEITGITYIVEHYQYDLDGNPVWVATDTKSGTFNADTEAEAKTYTGFTAVAFEQKKIAADGSTVVEIYYTRNTYRVTWDNGTPVDYLYGADIVAPADPTRTYYTFTGWDGFVEDMKMPAENKNFVSTWKATKDTNNNSVPDEFETAYFNYTVVGSEYGEVSLSISGYASMTWNESLGKYEILIDTIKNANVTVNITAVPKDDDASDGDVDYLVSNPATAIIVPGDDKNVTVEFGTHELNANNGELPINKSVQDASTHLQNLKNKVLTAAGLPTNGNYTVKTALSVTVLGSEITLTLDITNAGVNEILPSGLEWAADYVDGAALLAMDLSSKATKDFTITDNTTGVSKTVTHTIVDTRLPATVDALTQKDFGKFDTQAQFETAVRNAITASWTNLEGGSGKVTSGINVSFSNPVTTTVDGKTVKTYSVTVSVSAGTDWLASAAPVTIEGLTWTVNQYEITWVDGNNNVLYSEMLDYDATPSFNPEKNEIAEGENPTKTATAQYTYNFNGKWDANNDGKEDDLAKVTAAATYTALFDANVNEYTVTWIWVNKGGETITITQTEVPYGTVPTFDEVNNEKPTKAPTTVDGVTTEWTWNGGWTAVENVDPEGKFITGNAVYNPTFIEAKGHKVTFMNGTTTVVVKFVNTDEGETTVDSLPTLDDPKNDNLTFTGWFVGETQFTKDTEVTGDIVVTANWETDENNNNVDDDQEKATVTVTIEGAGSVTLTPAGNATELSQNGNVYTFLFDSTDDSSKVINVTATPNDQIASDGSMGYVVSAPKTVTLASGQNATVEAKFDVRTLTVTSGTIAVNKYYTENSDVKALEGLRDKILIEAGLDPNGSYTVTTTVSGVQAVVKITNDGAFYTLAGNNVDVSQLFVLALDNDANRTFIITQAADGILPEVSTSVTMGITDSRTPTTVAHTATKPYTAGTLATPVLEDIRANLVVNPGVENSGITIVDVVWDSANPEGTELEEGKLYDNIKIIVKVTENENFCGTEIPVTVAVQAPYIKATITIDEKANIEFNNSMTDEDKTEAVLAVVNPVHTPALPDGVSATVWYLASEARNVDYTINLAQLDLGAFGNMLVGNVLPEIYTVQIPVEEMWLNIGDDLTIPDAPSNERLSEILSNLLSKYAASYLAGEMSDDDLKDILKRTLAENPDIAEYYKYLGAHKFAENEKVDTNGNILEYVYLSVSDYGFGAAKSDVCELTLADTRIESEIKLNTGVEVTYNNYTEEELLALILDGVYANGQKIGGLTVEFVTDVEGLPASDASEVTVKFAGNKDYKPATATVAIKINKAPVTVSVDNRLYKWHDGFTYSLSDVIRTNPAGVDTINFVAGLDVHEVNLNGGLKGFVAKVQLMLPEDLQSLLASADALLQSAGLNVSFADGASMKLSELLAAVDALDHLFAGTEYEEYFRVLLNMLQSLPTDVADIEIVIGGALPTDIGVYVVGAISADANYTTDFGVGAVVIYPDGTKVDLAWNQNDDNYIITNTLLTTKGADGKYLFDAGATAFVRDTNYTEVDPTATEQVAEIFLGVDIDGNITVEMDQTKLNVGAYIEVAMAVEWGNEMYYSVPIVRPIVVVAETLNVDFRDDNGNVNNERHFEFFNVAQDAMEKNLLVTYKKDGNGYKAGDEVTDYSVKFFYVGVQTNGKPYASTQAPVHAGVYTITAVVTLRDASGAITHAGQGIGALVIEPSKSTIDVENEAIKWDGSEHNFNQYVHAESVNTDLIPDTTVITVGISADLNANIGLDAIEGTFNVDLPAWMDELMKKLGILEAGYTDAGITVAQFKSYVQKLEEAMAELGVDSAAFDKVIDVIGQMSDKATLTFHDDKGYTDIGAYLVIGIVTDSDHWPSADAGIVVIYPDGEKAELKYAETWDDNNVFTWNVLQHYDLNAEAYLKGEFSQDLTDKTLNLFVGFADHGELILTKNKAELDNGIYAEVSFLLILDNVMYYAEPIAREVIIVPNPADVDFLDDAGNVNNDRHFQFTNQAHAMGKIQVVLADGTKLVLDADDDRLDILYVGVQLNGKPYASAEAPVHAGVYEVTAQYTERKDGKVYNLGIGIGMLVIEPSKSETVVDNGAYPYGETHHVNDLVHVSSVNVPSITPDATVISAGLSTNLDTISGLSSIKGTVNVDLPAWMDDVLNKLNILDAGYADGISRETFLSYVEKIESGLKELGVETDAFAEITNVIKQLPVNTTLTFKDNIGYTNIGAYLIIAVVTDSDHYPSVGAGVMVIYPDATKAELRFEEDWNGNNIFTWSALQNMNLEAKAYVNGVESVEASKHVTNLYVGFTSDGTVMLEAVSYGEHVKDLPEFKNGVYSQIAVLLDLDNQLYYAEPISRAFMIVPTPANIEFVGENVFTFDNQTHALDVQVTINGAVVTDLSGLELHYTGIMTNGKVYASNEAPAHAGVYVVTASYTVRDEHDRLVTLGVAVGSLVIKPAKAEIDVTNRADVYVENETHDTASMITVSSNVNVNIDKTVITVGLKTDGTFSENGLSAIDGDINVDLPKWLDDVLSNYSIFANGLSVAEFKDAVASVKAELAELGISTEILDRLVNVVEQFPATATLTFHDQADMAPTTVGAYLVIGVVTDANFYPAMDAGLLVIYPDVQKTNLSWIYEDVNNNNIYTKDTLETIDLGAKADADISDLIVNLFIGVDAENWKITLENNQAELNIGVYEEFSFVKPNVNSVIYYAEPISRPVIVVANFYNVSIHDKVVTEMFDNTAKDMGEITVTTMDGAPVDITKGTLTVTYVGIDTMLRPYYSTEKPVHAGTYTVIATYVGNDDDGDLSFGAGIGQLIIQRAAVDVQVESHALIYGQPYDFRIDTFHNAVNDEPKVLTILAGVDLSAYTTEGKLGIDGTVNVDFPEPIDAVLSELFPDLYVNGIGTDAFFTKYDEMVAAIEERGYSADLLKQLKTMLSKLNAVNLTFNDAVKPTETGLYAVIAMTFDPDYQHAVDTALIAIAPDAVVGELDFVADMPQVLNAEVLPFDMLDSFDFRAYVSALKSASGNLNAEDIAVKDVIFGLTTDLELFLGSSQEKPNAMGVYDQIAYAPLTENNLMAILPIHRDFLVTDSTANVVYVDPNGNVNWLREFTYGETVDMGAKIMLSDGTILDVTPNVTYVGIENGVEFYRSSEVPTDAGLYTVFGYYMDADENIYTIGLAELLIKPKEVTITVADETMTFGDALPTLTYTVNGLVDGDSLAVNVSTEADGTMVGTYDITATYTADPNYKVTVVNGKLTIEKKTITAADVVLNGTLIYSGTEQTQQITVTNGVTYTVSGNTATNAGEYTLTVTGTGNYTGTVDVKWTVAAKEVTITVADETITAGETPKLNYTVDGLVNGDDLNVIVTVDGDYSVSGTYDITATYTADPNYDVTVVKGKLTVEAQREVKWAASAQFGNTLSLAIGFHISDIGEAEGYYAVLTRSYSDGRADHVVTVNREDWISQNHGGKAYYFVVYNGIAAKEMIDGITVVVYDAEGNPVAAPYTESVRSYAMRALSKHSVKNASSTLYVDLLNYGAAAQDYFNYAEDNMANRELSNEQKAFATAQNISCDNNLVADGNFVGAALQMKSAIRFALVFRNVENATHAVVSFTNHKGDSIQVVVDAANFIQNGTAVVVEDIRPADCYDLITVTVYNGNVVLAEAVDSLESYVARAENIHDVYQAFMKYANSALEYYKASK